MKIKKTNDSCTLTFTADELAKQEKRFKEFKEHAQVNKENEK